LAVCSVFRTNERKWFTPQLSAQNNRWGVCGMDGGKKFYVLRDRDRIYVIEATPDEVERLVAQGQKRLGPPCDTREEAESILSIFRP
jgi:hypothetical protein